MSLIIIPLMKSLSVIDEFCAAEGIDYAALA